MTELVAGMKPSRNGLNKTTRQRSLVCPHGGLSLKLLQGIIGFCLGSWLIHTRHLVSGIWCYVIVRGAINLYHSPKQWTIKINTNTVYTLTCIYTANGQSGVGASEKKVKMVTENDELLEGRMKRIKRKRKRASGEEIMSMYVHVHVIHCVSYI